MLHINRSYDARPAQPAAEDLGVVPRWEWRTFERTFVAPPAAPALDAPAPGDGVVVREETYLLSFLSPHSVKILDDRLEIKRLVQTGVAGLEQWRPVLHAPFPISAALLAAACDAWGVLPPAPDAPALSLADLLRHVVVPHRDLRIVSLVKRRIPITVAGCAGERAQITLGKHRWNTVSLEDADPARVRAALAELTLDATRNENYPRALKRILGLPDHSSVPSAGILH